MSGAGYLNRRDQVEQILAALASGPCKVEAVSPKEAVRARDDILAGVEDVGIAILSGKNRKNEREDFVNIVSREPKGAIFLFGNNPSDPDMGAAFTRMGCNRADIERFLNDDPELENEPPVMKISEEHRRRNGCLERCHVWDKCVCGDDPKKPACFPSSGEKCCFCVTKWKSGTVETHWIKRGCAVMNVGRFPDLNPFNMEAPAEEKELSEQLPVYTGQSAAQTPPEEEAAKNIPVHDDSIREQVGLLSEQPKKLARKNAPEAEKAVLKTENSTRDMPFFDDSARDQVGLLSEQPKRLARKRQ